MVMQNFRGDMQVIREYERKKREIEQREEEVNAMQHKINSVTESIRSVKEPWHQKLKNLVSSINESFSQFFKEIGCVGEVVLDDSSEVSVSAPRLNVTSPMSS